MQNRVLCQAKKNKGHQWISHAVIAGRRLPNKPLDHGLNLSTNDLGKIELRMWVG